MIVILDHDIGVMGIHVFIQVESLQQLFSLLDEVLSPGLPFVGIYFIGKKPSFFGLLIFLDVFLSQ